MSAHTATSLAFASIAVTDLARVAGGAAQPQQTFQQFTDAERARIMPAYRNVVATGAGIKGGPQLAEGLWKNATAKEQIAAANALRELVLSNPRLPTAAPATPF